MGVSCSPGIGFILTFLPSPGLVSYGSPLGLEEIQGEESTHDGAVIDPLSSIIPKLLVGNEVISAVDGLQFGGRDTL